MSGLEITQLQRLVVERQVDFAEVDEFHLEASVRPGSIAEPLGDGSAPASGAGTGDHDL